MTPKNLSVEQRDGIIERNEGADLSLCGGPKRGFEIFDTPKLDPPSHTL